MLLASKEQSLNDKINSLKEGKDFLELELAKLRLEIIQEESVRQQTADLQTELEKRTQSLQTELAKTRERESKIIQDNQSLLEKLVHTEKSSASLELQLKSLSAKYDQEVKAIHSEMERKSPASNQEDQVKGIAANYCIHLFFYILSLEVVVRICDVTLQWHVAILRPFYSLTLFYKST